MQLSGFKKIIMYLLLLVVMVTPAHHLSVQAEGSSSEQSSVAASGEATTIEEVVSDSQFPVTERYSEYLTSAMSNAYDGDVVQFNDLSQLSADSLATYAGETVIEANQDETVTFQIEAPRDAYYYIGFDYMIDGDNALPTQLEMKVNGSFPYYELRNLVFENLWENPSEIPLDKYGNEIIPQPIKHDDWLFKYVIDASYRTSEPLLIGLDQGDNEIEITISEGNLRIKAIELAPRRELNAYQSHEVTGDAFIEIEAARQLYLRNDSAIRANASYNVNLMPYSSDKRVLNHIDPDSFKTPGDKISYQFDVEEAGYYHLGLNYQQDAKADFPVFMNVEINGEIPNQLLENYPFLYQNQYTQYTLTDDALEPMVIYLAAGTHTVSFQLTIQPIKAALEQIERLTNDIQNLSLELTNLVGPDVDRYRDINVEAYIPGVIDLINGWADEMQDIYQEMNQYDTKSDEVGAFSSLRVAESQLRSLTEEPRELARRKGELSTGTNSVTAYLGNLMQEMNDNGIGIDRFYFYQEDVELPKKASVFSRIAGSVTRFFNTFGEQDYDVSNVNEENLQVWVNRPRQYVEIMQRLIDETFTSETGVKVDLSMMPDQNKLILANAAGNAPDVALGVNYALPFEIGIRDALQDLTVFDDYEEVTRAFSEGMLVPATIQDGVYALPDTMNFWVMFYRKDILADMGLPIPETIEDVRSYLPELQRRGMNFFYPTAGMPGMKIFAGTMPLIYQNGGQLYGDTVHRTMLNENEAIEGMRRLTELFTIYNIPYDVPSFYQQFRDGSIPIGISDYYMYNLILNAAPEIANVWDIALVPGIENASGEIERWSTGGAESNIMFKDTDKTSDAWAFMKWWADKDTQVAFGNTLQTTYGPEYMWNTANLEAYEDLPWANDHKQVILKQAEWIAEVPRVPGSYLLERELSNAYNAIVLDGENLRTAIDLASKRVNRETERKLEEFGFIHEGELIEPYPNPELSSIE
ncbi:carbohydrate ABC transporter substrate-binding protein (CUT1 family) [Streptohalobacillus salinus]|uniref:Carbohydrate ABC transporter substrate-binding protein (CUT1 family) n=1 Tax=Streptohalobacillus salinus TaxID=621096 RepID=A0A2V3WHE9_9BACI|nr:extracellular solute-binding protein [Streptohalobacillus salinus]PXW92971.1 carbohydrate ABC transporter substrate-binding protein (CUT1 family) [Streptohalobacillus salinus]